MTQSLGCKCSMFRALGTCWHTGFRGNQRIPLEPVSRAELRRRAFLKLLEEKGRPDGKR